MDSPKDQPPQEASLHFLDYWRIIRIRKAIIITVFLITAIIATAVTFILPTAYSSTSQIKISPDNTADVRGMDPMTTATPAYDPYFLQTELEILQEGTVLGKVVDALNLNVSWGKKFGVDTLKTSETVEFLKRQMYLSPVRNTTLVDITVYSADKNEAAALANAIAQAYSDYRQERHRKITSGGIKILEEQYKSEEDELQTIRANVDKLRKDLAIADTDPQSFVPSPTFDQEQLREFHSMMMEGQSRYMKLKEQLNQLKALSREKVRDALLTLTKDTALSGWLEKLHESEQTLVTKTNYYGPDNADIATIQSLIVKLNQQIDDRVAGIMIVLENNLNTEKAALDTLTTEVESAKQNDQEEAVRGQPYWEEKRNLAN